MSHKPGHKSPPGRHQRLGDDPVRAARREELADRLLAAVRAGFDIGTLGLGSRVVDAVQALHRNREAYDAQVAEAADSPPSWLQEHVAEPVSRAASGLWDRATDAANRAVERVDDPSLSILAGVAGGMGGDAARATVGAARATAEDPLGFIDGPAPALHAATGLFRPAMKLEGKAPIVFKSGAHNLAELDDATAKLADLHYGWHNTDPMGFVDDSGKFYTREQAADHLGISQGESSLVAKAQEPLPLLSDRVNGRDANEAGMAALRRLGQTAKLDEPERIVAAGVRTKTGEVFPGPVHGVAALDAEDAGHLLDPTGQDLFITSHGRVIPRKEADSFLPKEVKRDYAIGVGAEDFQKADPKFGRRAGASLWQPVASVAGAGAGATAGGVLAPEGHKAEGMIAGGLLGAAAPYAPRALRSMGEAGHLVPPRRVIGDANELVRLEHYGKGAQEAFVDPAFQGTGLRGAERKRRANVGDDEYVPRAYAYIAGTKPEPGLRGTPAQLTMRRSDVLPEGRLGDYVTKAEEQLKGEGKALTNRDLVVSRAERLARDDGWKGYQQGNVVAFFEPLPTGRLGDIVAGAHAKNGGATFDPRTGRDMAGSDTWAVATKTQKLFDEAPTPDEVRAFIDANAEALKDPNKYVGSWDATKVKYSHGKHELNITEVYPTQAEAMKVARSRGEDAITHLDPEFTFPTVQVESAAERGAAQRRLRGPRNPEPAERIPGKGLYPKPDPSKAAPLPPIGEIRRRLDETEAAVSLLERNRPSGLWAPYERGIFDRSGVQGEPGFRMLEGVNTMPPASGTPTPMLSELLDNRRLRNVLDRQANLGLGMGGEGFYNLSPVRQSYGEMGGPVSFEDFVAASSAGSAQSPVPLELSNASILLYAQQHGISMREAANRMLQMYPQSQGAWIAPTHDVVFQRYLQEGIINPPSPASGSRKIAQYARQKLGESGGPGRGGGTIDTHEGKALLQPVGAERYDVRKTGAEYEQMADVYREGGSRLGVPSESYQAGRWIGGGPLTGLVSPMGDYVQHLEDTLLWSAIQMGLPTDPASLRRYWERVAQGQDFILPFHGKKGFPMEGSGGILR